MFNAVLSTLLLVCFQAGFAHAKDKEPYEKDGIIYAADGRVFAYYKQENNIVIESCDPGSSEKEKFINCKQNKVPVETFKKLVEKHLCKDSVKPEQVKELETEVNKIVNFILDPGKRSKEDQAIYLTLIELDPNKKRPCGLKGSVEERILDCSMQPDSDREGFVLVARTTDDKEVYRDSSGVIWAERLQERKDYYDAERSCKEGIPETAGITGLKWRLPTFEEYKAADKFGIRYKLLKSENWYWTSSKAPDSLSLEMQMFDGYNGGAIKRTKQNKGVIRCVAK